MRAVGRYGGRAVKGAVIGALLFTALPPYRLTAQTPQYIKLLDTLVAMRDGVRLHTSVYVPANRSGTPLPILFLRTPYGIDRAAGRFGGNLKELAEDGYIFAFQDLRGHYGSEGTFVMQRPPRANPSDPHSIDEGTDAYDTIEWLIHHVDGNNGKVGMLGVSYDGWLVVQALLEPHPALAAASPQASPADMWKGDDFHHNGAFRLSYGFEYAYSMEQGNEVQQFPFDRADTYDWYLSLGPLRRVDSIFGGRIPTWKDFVAHPNYDEFWLRQAGVPNIHSHVRRVTVPTLNVAGWWDQEDFYGALVTYAAFEDRDSSNLNFIVVGPWNHGGWGGPGRRLGAIDFGDSTGLDYRRNIQRPFFACYLKGRQDGCPRSEATLWRSGVNQWVHSDAFPRQQGVERRNLYLRENGQLSFEPETRNVAADSFLSDPANPVPYRPRPIQVTYGPRSRWYTWLLEDQRFVDHRPDVLSWSTAPLTEDITVSGDIVARLFASTSQTDADWIAKLIDVYPEDYDSAGSPMNGYELMIANDVLRGRFSDGTGTPHQLIPNRVQGFSIDMHPQEYTFKRGHRIMVQVQSSWFPIIDRNPQRYVPNIFEARASDFVKAIHTIQRSSVYPSHIELPVVTP